MLRVEIDPSAERAVYRQLADIIRSNIRSGKLAPGATLPSAKTYAQQYGIGIDAVRDALALLQSEGLIVTVPRVGSHVRPDVAEVALTLGPGARIRARMPSPEERRELQLSQGIPVLVVSQPGKPDELAAADRTVLVIDNGQA